MRETTPGEKEIWKRGEGQRGRGEAPCSCLPNESSGYVHVRGLPVLMERKVVTFFVCIFHAWLGKHICVCVSCWVASDTAHKKKIQPFGNSHCTLRLKPQSFLEIQHLSPVSTSSWPFLGNGCQWRQGLLERSNLLLSPSSAPARHFPRRGTLEQRKWKVPPFLQCSLRWVSQSPTGSQTLHLAYYQVDDIHENKLGFS